MMTHQLTLRLGSKADLAAAQKIVEDHHYLHQRVHQQARPMVYMIEHATSAFVGLVMVATPHATCCRGWWGYPDLPSQWQVVDLCRIWLVPAIQTGGHLCRPGTVPGFADRRGLFRPTTPTWAISEVLSKVQVDRVSQWPPVYPAQPYHIRLAISYHDPVFHRGTIYRHSGALPLYTDETDDRSKVDNLYAAALAYGKVPGKPIPGASGGKFAWCWPLHEPTWSWDQIEIRRPRTMRFEFV